MKERERRGRKGVLIALIGVTDHGIYIYIFMREIRGYIER